MGREDAHLHTMGISSPSGKEDDGGDIIVEEITAENFPS